VKSDPSEYKEVLRKLLEKTRQRRVDWKQAFSSSFRCDVGPGDEGSFSFTVSGGFPPGGGEVLSLEMSDEAHNTIFSVTSNDLPTSPEEEETSQMIEELYELARRQALKIEQKLELASSLLDRV
jgi:hypothetical protein